MMKKWKKSQIYPKNKKKEPTNSSSETEKSKERSSSNKTNSTETPKVEDKTSVKENTNYQPQSENTKTEQNNIPQNTNTEPTPTDTVKENTPWDSLGITEYDYYNKPAQSWANLQFKISDYGSREATEKACHEYGDNNIPEGRAGYWCLSVNSYSGDYLGEEIDFFKTLAIMFFFYEVNYENINYFRIIIDSPIFILCL